MTSLEAEGGHGVSVQSAADVAARLFEHYF
jgi:hypothetical protein